MEICWRRLHAKAGRAGDRSVTANQRPAADAHRDLWAVPRHSFGSVATRTRHADHHEKVHRPEQIANE